MAATLFLHKGAMWRLKVQATDEIGCAEQFIGGVLAGATDLIALIPVAAWYRGLPVEDVAPPFLYYAFQHAEEDEDTYGEKVATLIFVIAAVEQIETGAEYPTANAASAILRTLFDGIDGTVTGTIADGAVINCDRVSPWQLEEAREVQYYVGQQ